ncbi:DUF805 domain-containing protein [Sphingobacterium sp. N143]|uniref:DUF805 domain-containing protein n=1 Tax=Sphingobacterium sp. N143 TaxID=2746727 RepID=UPI0025790612|nr:DUF805 domain-containing protein [Sphingobacterium sp. N143]MDM1296025.1 DUF805 domain-containing protein [Sphingobacterium sp. N143]
MELKEVFLKVVRDNYANFEGRARRKEYWMFVLAQIVLYIGLAIIGGIFSVISDTLGNLVFGLISLLSLALLIPGLAVTVRRLHDTNKSGWFILVALIPFVGGLYLLYLEILEGDKGPNQYGPDPKALENGTNHPFTQQAQDPFGSSQTPNPPTPPTPPKTENDPFA